MGGIGRLAGYACFAVVAIGVILGITFIVASGLGKELDLSVLRGDRG